MNGLIPHLQLCILMTEEKTVTLQAISVSATSGSSLKLIIIAICFSYASFLQCLFTAAVIYLFFCNFFLLSCSFVAGLT